MEKPRQEKLLLRPVARQSLHTARPGPGSCSLETSSAITKSGAGNSGTIGEVLNHSNCLKQQENQGAAVTAGP
eukprot:284216-Hanusia_phi.AAC.1